MCQFAIQVALWQKAYRQDEYSAVYKCASEFLQICSLAPDDYLQTGRLQSASDGPRLRCVDLDQANWPQANIARAFNLIEGKRLKPTTNRAKQS